MACNAQLIAQPMQRTTIAQETALYTALSVPFELIAAQALLHVLMHDSSKPSQIIDFKQETHPCNGRRLSVSIHVRHTACIAKRFQGLYSRPAAIISNKYQINKAGGRALCSRKWPRAFVV